MVAQVLKLAHTMPWPLRRFAIAALPRVVCGAEGESGALYASAPGGALGGGWVGGGGSGGRLCAPYTRPEDAEMDRQIVSLLRDSLAHEVSRLGQRL
jgi:hypothetical protein